MSINPLRDIYLEDTFVIGWHEGHESLTFYVLASLEQTHPQASAPASGDWACYRPCIIQFVGVSSISGLLRQESVKPGADASGDVDYGNIDSFKLVDSGEYRIVGDFGDVLVAAREILVYLAAAA
jgi:hypothetical protein